jgi:hypothetical protein
MVIVFLMADVRDRGLLWHQTIMNDCILDDLGSTNGTLVNGVHALRNNDVIELGKYKLKFVGAATAGTVHAPTPADYEKTMVWRPGGAKPPRRRSVHAPVRRRMQGQLRPRVHRRDRPTRVAFLIWRARG